MIFELIIIIKLSQTYLLWFVLFLKEMPFLSAALCKLSVFLVTVTGYS